MSGDHGPAAGSAETEMPVEMPTCPGMVPPTADVCRQQLFSNPIPSSSIWTCCTVSVHCTSSDEFVYNKRRPRPGEAHLELVNGAMINVEWFGMLDLVVHCKEDFHATLNDVAVVPGFRSDSLSFRRLAAKDAVLGTHTSLSILNGKLSLVSSAMGDFVQATRVPHAAAPSTVAKAAASVRLQPKPTHIPPPEHPSWGEGGLFDCGSNAFYHQAESAPAPPANMVYKCARCCRLGHKYNDCCAPRRFEGNCTSCGEYGHMSGDCLVALQTRHRANAVHL